jgi:cell division transport system permease protein
LHKFIWILLLILNQISIALTEEKKYKKKKKLGSYPYSSVVFSITLALFVIGLFGLLLLHTNSLTQIIRENVQVQIYLNTHVTENERIMINKTLSGKEYIAVKEGKVQIDFISKDEAAKKFIEETGEDFISFLGENPLKDAYIININPDFHTENQMTKIKSEIESISGVFEAKYTENLIESINKNLTKIGMILIGFAVILLTTVIVLINNTIKLALFSQRFLIRSMQLVGARSSFIQKPFLLRAALQGLFSGILAIALLVLVMNYANSKIDELVLLQDINKILILFISLVFLGLVIGFLSTFRAINKYLKLSLDELY